MLDLGVRDPAGARTELFEQGRHEPLLWPPDATGGRGRRSRAYRDVRLAVERVVFRLAAGLVVLRPAAGLVVFRLAAGLVVFRAEDVRARLVVEDPRGRETFRVLPVPFEAPRVRDTGFFALRLTVDDADRAVVLAPFIFVRPRRSALRTAFRAPPTACSPTDRTRPKRRTFPRGPGRPPHRANAARRRRRRAGGLGAQLRQGRLPLQPPPAPPRRGSA